MPVFENLFLAVLTNNEDDAGSSCTLNLTVNVDGQDILDDDYGCDLDDGEAGLLGGGALVTSLDTTGVTDSSIRVGIRDDDAWGPEHVLLFGQTRADFRPGRTAALAIETEVSRWLSTDASEGRLSMPVRLVGSGDADRAAECWAHRRFCTGPTRRRGARSRLARARSRVPIALRIGMCAAGRNLPETLDPWLRQMWLSDRDYCRGVHCAVLAPADHLNFAIINLMSRNQGMRWELESARELIGYEPLDGA